MSKSALDFYFDLIRDIPVLTQEQELRLIQQAQAGSKRARNKLIKHNLKLVAYVIRRRYHATKMPLSDLIAEGNFGLIPAIKNFNTTKGIKFSTYAVYWIRQAIIRAIIDKGFTIRVPVYMYEVQSRYLKFVERFEIIHNRPPTEKEIKKALKLPNKTYQALQDSLISTTSLDKPIYTVDVDEEYKGTLYGELQAEPKVKDKIDFSHKDFKVLSERELDMVKMKYGFADGNAYTLQEIANKYKMSRERVRQIIEKSLKLLSKSKYIKEFFGK